MWFLSVPAQQSLVQSHSMTMRAIAYGPYGTQQIPVGGGGCTSDARSQVRRQATLLTDLSLWPVDPRSVLAPLGTEIQVDYGIVLPDRSIEWVPQIRGLLTEGSRSQPIPSDGTLPLKLVDRSARVAEDRFTAPVQTVSGATVVTEIRRLIQETLGGSVAVVDRTGSTQVAPLLEIERERWSDGVEKLADALGAEVFFDPQGNGVIRFQPTLADPQVWVVATGPQGILVGKDTTITREEMYNGVVVSGQRTDGTAPVTATTWDTDPNSPTYYLGAFGKKPKFYTSPLLTTTLQCQTTGAAMLARSKGMVAQTKVTAFVNPALEAGDVVLAQDVREGTSQVHIIDKVTTPWSPSEAQPLETRTTDVSV